VGRPALHRRRAARFAGLVQLSLALGALGEVARRALLGSTPEPITMMSVALLALAANATCLALVGRHRHGGVHMKASYIFSANDVIANLGVIVGGALVAWSGSRLPDLVVGSAVAAVVLAGAIRILRLR
jgi:Co/Zn/Cd efflux system component